MIANCGPNPRTVEIGREWIAADLLLGNLPDTPATSMSTSLDLAGWECAHLLRCPLSDPSPDVHLMKAEVGNSTPLTSVLLGSASRDAASRWHTSMIMFQARAISIY